MLAKKSKIFKILNKKIVLALFLFFPTALFAATTITIPVSALTQHATIYYSPQTSTFVDGSTFSIPVFIDTQGRSINTIDLKLKFDPSKLEIIRPLGENSIIGIWLEPPSYSNSSGVLSMTGTIPNGIVTGSGLITTITFKAKSSGVARISLSPTSQVLANDGQGSGVQIQTTDARYTIIPQPPGEVRVFSDTHPYQDRWYNNNSPVFGWDTEPGITAFSYVLDDKPSTIPPNEEIGNTTSKGYENLSDGIWYFHLKAKKAGVWGATTNFLVRIDTAPPAQFTPTIDTLTAAVIRSKGMVSYFTTDSLSGVDHYEVGVLSASDAPDASPAYVQAESPYQIPGYLEGKTRIIVRAYDRAGNIRSAAVNASPVNFLALLAKNNLFIFILGIILLLILFVLDALFFGAYVRRFFYHVASKIERFTKESESVSPPQTTTYIASQEGPRVEQNKEDPPPFAGG